MILSRSFTVTTTRQQITLSDDDLISGTDIWLYGEYHGSSSKIAFGGADVTMANGLHLYGGEKFGPIHISHGESLYVVSDSADGIDLRVLQVGL